VESFAEGLEIPWDLDFLPDGRALVTERPGRIRLIAGGQLADRPYAAVTTESVGEGGLMGLAVHPDYPEQPYLYIMYTYRAGTDLYNRVVRLRDTGATAVEDKTIVEGIPGNRVHNGGRIAFGPDRMLYVCTGDAGRAEIAQDIENLGGKILRYTPEGTVPKDNPFSGSPVYAYGLRNPQGLAWHPETGDLFSSEHGPSGEFGLFGRDSINVIIKGGNYGWPLVLGAVDMEPYIDPVVFWPKPTPPAGMTFYRGDLYVTTLRGEALIRIGLRGKESAYEAQSIQRLFASDWFRGEHGRLRHVVEGPDGNLYVLTSNLDGRGTPREGDDKILCLKYRQ
jgi:quinoprotein glucose dehydrogenase